jgi:7-carboxy-7-deazaguanine synthase
MGESRHTGRSCTIVRLAGCQHKCVFCDSFYSHNQGTVRSVDEILAEVRAAGFKLVLVTGGEPLQQPDVVGLMDALLAAGHDVVLETSGTQCHVRLDEVPDQVSRVVDIKAPGSGIDRTQIDWDGIAALGDHDELKVVCRDRDDYLWARDLIRSGERLPAATGVTFSASHRELAPESLAEWILEDKLNVRMQVQLHKVLWPDRERGV